MNVSVVIAAYNAQETIAETLESLLAQTHKDWEAIVIDDGSTDPTGEIAQKFVQRDERIRMTTQANGGEAAARNTGIALASYDWLLFLDSDDWIAPTHLERMTGELLANPELDAVHCGYARVAVDGTEVIETYQPPTGDLFPTLARRPVFPIHCCIVRRSLVEEVGNFDLSFKKSTDWDLWQRIARRGARFGAVRDILAFYRMRPNSMTMDAYELLKYDLRLLKQGSSFDPRVPNPKPEHANGVAPEELRGQKFYLLCWCAGLLLGQGQDARPLFKMLKEETYPELYAEAVAQCIFESAPLPAAQPPAVWEKLLPTRHRQIDRFLVALEKRSMAPDLAQKVDAQLKKMILRHSPTWHAVIAEYEQEIAKQGLNNRQIEETIEKLESNLQKLEQRQAEEREQKKNWQQRAAQEEEEKRSWQQRAVKQEEQKKNWQKIAAEKESIIAELQQKFWVRLGLRLRVLEQASAEKSDQNHENSHS